MCPACDITFDCAGADDATAAAQARQGCRAQRPAAPRDLRRRRCPSPTTKDRSTWRAGRSIRSGSRAPTARIKWIVLYAHARHLLRAAVRALGSRTGCARPGRAGRSAQRPLLLLLHRDLAAGSLLPHRPAHPGGDDAVPDERGRRAGLVRLSLSADGVDRSVPDHRALGRGRPPRAPAARSAAVDDRAARAHRRSSTFSG